jgi:hypothetical protein
VRPRWIPPRPRRVLPNRPSAPGRPARKSRASQAALPNGKRSSLLSSLRDPHAYIGPSPKRPTLARRTFKAGVVEIHVREPMPRRRQRDDSTARRDQRCQAIDEHKMPQMMIRAELRLESVCRFAKGCRHHTRVRRVPARSRHPAPPKHPLPEFACREDRRLRARRPSSKLHPISQPFPPLHHNRVDAISRPG